MYTSFFKHHTEIIIHALNFIKKKIIDYYNEIVKKEEIAH